jgi:hypothetical protein
VSDDGWTAIDSVVGSVGTATILFLNLLSTLPDLGLIPNVVDAALEATGISSPLPDVSAVARILPVDARRFLAPAVVAFVVEDGAAVVGFFMTLPVDVIVTAVIST